MKSDVEILKEHFGSRKALAKALGITERHVRNIERNQHIGTGLRKLMRIMVQTLTPNGNQILLSEQRERLRG